MKNSELQKLLQAFSGDYEIGVFQYNKKLALIDGLKIYPNAIAFTEGETISLECLAESLAAEKENKS